MRFEDENGEWIKFDSEFTSNHRGKFKKCGSWAYPIFPKARALQGSIPTPYIFDDRCSYEDVSKAIRQWYDTPSERRTECGLEGSEWVNSEESGMSARHMGQRFIDSMNGAFENWKPKTEVTLWKI